VPDTIARFPTLARGNAVGKHRSRPMLPVDQLVAVPRIASGNQWTAICSSFQSLKDQLNRNISHSLYDIAHSTAAADGSAISCIHACYLEAAATSVSVVPITNSRHAAFCGTSGGMAANSGSGVGLAMSCSGSRVTTPPLRKNAL